MKAQIGCPARSLAGHDKGKYFIILADLGEYLAIADGKTRTVEKPKKKKRMHLQASNTPILSGGEITNDQIQGALARFAGLNQKNNEERKLNTCQNQM